ncbi:TPR repeat protein [Stackebrandtia endophytica]|uniref:TPR repeat protein n=1 Tax=Stackebrandtia endophytica TaxID=1496996 RepID=A0A543AYQ1_9ACTN|nr:sel1 repeat family protein [Stackebrandtia endophytica]TQL77702.1 TPR repeat protein [Stackebrandtia endophytica]
MSDDAVSPTGTELKPWWKSAWLWTGGAVSVLAIGACVYFGMRLGTGPANDLAGIASFAAAVVSIVVTVVQGRRSSSATAHPPAVTHVNVQVSPSPVEPTTTPLSAHLLHVDETGTAPRVSQVPDAQLGVRSAVRQAEFGPTPYLERDVDDELTTAMRAGGMVVLYGPATAGKSRTATALLKRLFGDRHLYVPAEVGSLRALLDSGHQPQDAVVWLDNLEEYLGDRGIDRAVLSRLCPPGRGDVTVVATLRYEEYRKHGLDTEADQADDGKKPHPAGTALLRELKNQGRLFSLAADLSATERAGIARAQTDARPGDDRLSEAAESGRGFGEHLGAGEEMMQRWIGGGNILEKFGAAYISAAVDARRAGYHGPIPTDTLAELAEGYLLASFKERGNRPTSQDAVEWATQPVVGTETSTCLVPHRSGGYRAEDYLIDRAETPPSPLAGKPIREAIWPTVLSLADLEHLHAIGFAAYLADNHDIARTAWRRAAHAGDAQAMFDLGVMAAHRLNIIEAEAWWQKASKTKHYAAMLSLGGLLQKRGDTKQLETWWHNAVETGDAMTMFALCYLVEQHGDPELTESLWRKAVESGQFIVTFVLGPALCKHVDSRQVDSWCRAVGDAGGDKGMAILGHTLYLHGDTNAMETWLRNAIAAGTTSTVVVLGQLLRQEGKTEQASRWLHTANDAGDADAKKLLQIWTSEDEDGETASDSETPLPSSLPTHSPTL